uniref:Inositol polyphosphate multikinase-like n=1 Tax=Dermatophagoides pteronyssinus TaxID=6956 RepID=A0A6P6YAX7_DERPT|nr:inositol polyphosphate multikinase-like [Dermatophagoides pteronyssinus]
MNQMNSSSGGLPKSLYSSSSSTSASTMMVKTNSNSTCRISSPRSPSPPSFLLKGIQDKIKRNEFSKLEQLLAAKLQSKIPNKPKQSKPIQNHHCNNELLKNFWPNHHLIDEKSKKCLAIKSLSIKLHEKRLRQIFLRDQTGCFLVCLLEHENRLIEKPIIFINEWDIDDQLNDTITIDINEIFNIDDDDDDNDDNDDNKQDFIVTIKIFFMFHPIDNRQQQRKRRQEINWKKFIPIRGLMTKIVSSLKKRKRLDVKQIDLTSVARCLNQQQPINSSFQLLGQIKLDYSNLGQQQRPFRLEKFNYCW